MVIFEHQLMHRRTRIITLVLLVQNFNFENISTLSNLFLFTFDYIKKFSSERDTMEEIKKHYI